eukprot:SAG22_NODE_205_length_15308_cov_20.539023_14_plen_129_part_00
MLHSIAFACGSTWLTALDFGQVVPSEWGIKEKPWFVFQPSYWNPSPPELIILDAAAASSGVQQTDNPAAAPNGGLGAAAADVRQQHLEAESAEMRQQKAAHQCIHIRGLRKVWPFPDPSSPFRLIAAT